MTPECGRQWCRTYRAEGDTVDFFVGVKWVARKFYTDILVDTGVIGIVIAAVYRSGAAFDLHGALVVAGTSAYNQTSPVTRMSLAYRLGGSHYNRLLLCTGHFAVSAGFDDERGHSLLVALDDCPGRDAELCPGIHIHPSFEQVCSLGEGHVAGEVEILGAVAKFCPAFEEYAVGVGDIAFVDDGRLGRCGRFVIVVRRA